jgi:rifampicin phosphotransferase
MTSSIWQPIAGGTYLGQAPSKRFPLYTRGNAGEVFPEVHYPLSFSMSVDYTISAFERSMRSAGVFGDADLLNEPTAMTAVLGGYSYLNLSALRVVGVRSPGTTPEAIDEQYLGASSAPRYTSAKGDQSIKASVNAVRFLLRVTRTKALPQQDADMARVAAWKQTLPNRATATDGELLDALLKSQELLAELFSNHLIVSGEAAVPVALLSNTCTKKLKDPSLLTRLLGGAGGVSSAAPSTALWDLGRMVAQSTTLTALFDAGLDGLADRLQQHEEFSAAFAKFQAKFGSRGPNEWETACPTWGTHPELALTLVDRMRNADASHDPRIGMSTLISSRAVALAEADAKLLGTARKRLRKTLASSDLYAQGREQAKTTVVRAIHENRLMLRELAERVSKRSGGAFDDLWFVTKEELDAFLLNPQQFAGVIAERRAMRTLLSSKEPPFIVNGEIPDVSTWADRNAPTSAGVVVGQKLTGIAGCAGVARGRAVVVLDAGNPRDIGPGDVLVAPLTDPSWTPLFLAVEAVVVNVGAILSHAVIVSRELGIPSVVSVTDATKIIPNGALIEVDGAHGTVTILELP